MINELDYKQRKKTLTKHVARKYPSDRNKITINHRLFVQGESGYPGNPGPPGEKGAAVRIKIFTYPNSPADRYLQSNCSLWTLEGSPWGAWTKRRDGKSDYGFKCDSLVL